MAYEDDGGMGLEDFLAYDPDAEKGGGGDWLKPWKKAKSIDVWLHTLSTIRAVWGHQIPHEIEVDEKNDKGEKTGRKILKLAWPRFVSPDLGSVHANQYFRDGSQLRDLLNKDPKTGKPIGGSEATAFMRDPFLILREYLYHAIDKKLIEPDAIVFEWTDHKKKGELIQWTAGEMSRQVKRGFNNRGHSLDTKLEYIMVVVNHEKPGEGPKITRETKLVGDKLREEIKKQIESRGDEGNPFKVPYCFRWKFDPDAATPMKSYDVYRIDKNACTQEIWQAIGGEPDGAAGEKWEVVPSPDTAEYARVNDGDMDKIRQAFEQAAVIDLPFDAIFSDDWEVRKSVVTGRIITAGTTERRTTTETAPTGGTGSPTRPGAAPGASRPTGGQTTQTTSTGTARPASSSTSTAAAPASTPAATGPQPRRKKKVEEPAPTPPPKEPEPERVKCDGPDDKTPCDAMLLPTDTKCPKCGAEYEIDPGTVPVEAPKAAAAPAQTTSTGVKRPTARSAEETAELEALAKTKCVGCGQSRFRMEPTADGKKTAICENCGLDQGDDIPFG